MAENVSLGMAYVLLNVRISPEIKSLALEAAMYRNISLTGFIRQAVESQSARAMHIPALEAIVHIDDLEIPARKLFASKIELRFEPGEAMIQTQMRASEEWKAEIETKAQAQGMDTSEFIRSAMLLLALGPEGYLNYIISHTEPFIRRGAYTIPLREILGVRVTVQAKRRRATSQT